MKLSPADKVILESYIPVVHDLAAYLGDSFEIVLHSLEDYERSVIAIVNGEHTGRALGAPITDVALDMLEDLSQGKPAKPYFSKNKKGEPLKSSTIAVRGESGDIIGLLCINMYLNTPLCDLLPTLSAGAPGTNQLDMSETFAVDVEDLVCSNVESIRADVLADISILPSNKNKVTIERLDERGIFRMKNAVAMVANLLCISTNTVYMHIRNHRAR